MLLRLNGLNEEDYIYPEQNLLIPNIDYNFYITKDNDTFLSIANDLGKNIIDLIKENEALILEPNQLIIYK